MFALNNGVEGGGGGGREGEVNGILQTAEESAKEKERERESVRNVLLLGVVSMGRLYFRACCFSLFPFLSL